MITVHTSLRNIVVLAIVFVVSFSSCAEPGMHNDAISGPWLIELSTNDVGRMQVVMQIDVNEQKNLPIFAI